jgi:hypothetical protein
MSSFAALDYVAFWTELAERFNAALVEQSRFVVIDRACWSPKALSRGNILSIPWQSKKMTASR